MQSYATRRCIAPSTWLGFWFRLCAQRSSCRSDCIMRVLACANLGANVVAQTTKKSGNNKNYKAGASSQAQPVPLHDLHQSWQTTADAENSGSVNASHEITSASAKP